MVHNCIQNVLTMKKNIHVARVTPQIDEQELLIRLPHEQNNHTS